jgi:polyisoprenoid-binding protein YceI
VRHLGVSNVRGTFGNLSGTVTFDGTDFKKSSIVAIIDTTTINTGVSVRDAALKSDDFLDIAKYPTMTFKSTSITEDQGKLHLKGELTLHGVTRPVTLDMETPDPPGKGPKGNVRGFSASGIIQRDAFGLTKFSAIAGNDVRFTVDLEVDQQQ